MQTTTEGAARMFGRYWGEADIARTPEAFRCEAIDPEPTSAQSKSCSAAVSCVTVMCGTRLLAARVAKRYLQTHRVGGGTCRRAEVARRRRVT